MIPFQTPQKQQLGFTLVEMSIVLSIIGILVGAVVGGQHLMHTLRLKRVHEEQQHYSSAIQQFSDRYKALPGDMRNAVEYWQDVSNADTCLEPEIGTSGNDVGIGTGTETCNGNGDLRIGSYDVADLRHEMFRAWQHLRLAEFITGPSYTGFRDDTATLSHRCPGNCPTGPLKGSGWSLMFQENLTSSAALDNRWFNRDLGNMLVFGGHLNDFPSFNGALTPQEAWDMDTKFDDGSPVTGSISAVLGGSGGTSTQSDCTTADDDSTDLTATYSTATDAIACALYFILPTNIRGPQ